MKTNKIMIRKLGSFNVSQRTSDGLFNATELLSLWNISNNSKKEVSKFFELKQTKEFIEILENDLDTNTQDVAYLKSRGKYGGTWMHPYLFIDFAMWINPKFKLEVIKFVYDQLIQLRHMVGDYYNGLTSAVQRFENVNYSRIAIGLNFIVFGKHEPELRQKANEIQLKELADIQKQLAFAINMNYIKSFEELINEMRRVWHGKRGLNLMN